MASDPAPRDGAASSRHPERTGGTGILPGGERLTWSVAEGARGTRWRESVERDGRLVRSLLLEVAPHGRVTRLELTTAAGLLTLHPEPDESALHGNVVTPTGIRHLAFDWGPDHALRVEGSRATDATAGLTTPGGVARGLRIGDDLVPRAGTWTVDAEALAALADERTWPLERA